LQTTTIGRTAGRGLPAPGVLGRAQKPDAASQLFLPLNPQTRGIPVKINNFVDFSFLRLLLPASRLLGINLLHRAAKGVLVVQANL